MPSPFEGIYVEISKPKDIDTMWEQVRSHPNFHNLNQGTQKNLEKAFVKKNGHRIEKFWRDWYGGKRKWVDLFGDPFSNLELDQTKEI